MEQDPEKGLAVADSRALVQHPGSPGSAIIDWADCSLAVRSLSTQSPPSRGSVSSTTPIDVGAADSPIIVRQIHKTPQGYPRLGAFLDSDENFMVYRRFGYLQSRLLLEKQDELQQLERALNRQDKIDARKGEDVLRTRKEYGQDHMQGRVELLEKLEKAWIKYSELLCAAQRLTRLNKPTSGEYGSVKTWVEQEDPLFEADVEWAYHKEDLVTLRPGREYAWLDTGVERLLRACGWRFTKYIFQSKETAQKTDGSGGEIYYTRSRIERFVVMIITLMILVLLVLPIYVLYELSDGDETEGGSRKDFECIAVLLVFTLAFSACISLFTRARRHEILAASAAYCAVLVVFIGNLGNIDIGRK